MSFFLLMFARWDHVYAYFVYIRMTSWTPMPRAIFCV